MRTYLHVRREGDRWKWLTVQIRRSETRALVEIERDGKGLVDVDIVQVFRGLFDFVDGVGDRVLDFVKDVLNLAEESAACESPVLESTSTLGNRRDR